MTMVFSNRNRFFTLLAVLFLSLTLQSQGFSGRVVSSKGGEDIPFANVLVKGTTIGVATDVNGEFTISIPSDQNSSMLVVSAVGYSQKEVLISELNPLKVNVITLNTQEYNIDAVDVEAESKVLYGALKKCTRKIKENYINSAYTCDFEYTKDKQQAKGIYTDKTGYNRSTFALSYNNIAYQFKESGDTKNYPYFSGKSNMEDLLSFDLVRTVGNVLDEQNVYDFKLSLKKTASPQLWVIHFELPKPKLYNTGDAHAVNYSGEVFIDKSTFAITKITVRGLSGKRSIHGKQVYATSKSSEFAQELHYTVTTTYSTANGKYYLSSIEMKEDYSDANGKDISTSSSVRFSAPKAKVANITGRDYFVKSL